MAIYYVTVTGAGAKTGATWATAMGIAEFGTSLTGAAVAGDIYYIAAGTYTLTSSVDSSSRDGTNTAPITLVGVKSGTSNEPPIYSDWSDGLISGSADDRPIIALGTWTLTTGDCYKFINLAFTGTAATMHTAATDSIWYNCKYTQQSGTNDRVGVQGGSNSPTFLLCEFCGLVGTGVVGRGFYSSSMAGFYMCYFHDLRSGIYFSTSGTNGRIIECVFEDCSVYGLYGLGIRALTINCTFNDCATAHYGTSALLLAMNNIVEGSTVAGFSSDGIDNNGFAFKNHGNDARNVKMWLNVPRGVPYGDPIVTDGDPVFDADGNLSLASTSPCLNVGISMVLGK